jgi:hypothetical protein
MPASAHHNSACPEPAEGGRVIDFASRVRRRPGAAPVPQEGPVELGVEARTIAEAWEAAAAREGLSMTDPQTVAAARMVADMLEKLVNGAQAIREGDAAAGQEPNPSDGMDRVSAELMRGLLRDLRQAPAHVAQLRTNVREL